jgi:hypothetical protein
MTIMQVFKRPGQEAYTYKTDARSVNDAAQVGRALARENPEQWGQFCYARPTRQLLISLNEMYVLQPGQAHLRYRKEDEEVNAPFDYVLYSGRQGSDLMFPLTWIDPGSGGTVRLDAWFDAGKSFQFMDLCKGYLAKFVIADGQPILRFCNPYTHETIGEIALHRKQ